MKDKYVPWFLLGLLLVTSIVPVKASGEEWLTGWTYRKPNTITGSTEGAQTNYPVDIMVNFNIGSYDLEYADFDELGYAVIGPSDSSRSGVTRVSPPIVMRDPATMEAVQWGGKYWAVVYSRVSSWLDNQFDIYSSTNLLSWTEEYRNIIPDVAATWEAQIYVPSSFSYIAGDAKPFLIFYCARDGSSDTARCRDGAARSDDMETWTKNVNNPLFEYQNGDWAVAGSEVFSIAKLSTSAAPHKWIAIFEGDAKADRQGIGIAYNDDDDPDTTGWTYTCRSHSSCASGLRREVDPYIFRKGSRYYIFYEIYPTTGDAKPTGGMWADEEDVFTENAWTRFSTNPIIGSMGGSAHKCGSLLGFYVSDTLYLPFRDTAVGSTFAIVTDAGAGLSLNENCRTDFGDIRFTAADGSTQLVYQLREKVNGDWARFTVIIPSIPASPSDVTIYVYYGKDVTTTSTDLREDFTSYTEVDPNTHITVGEHQVNAILIRNEDAYLYKDFGVDYFDDFAAEFEVSITHDTDGSVAEVLQFANIIDDNAGIEDAGETAILLHAFDQSGASLHRFEAREIYDYILYPDTENRHDWVADATTYYLRMQKYGTAFSVAIYSDSGFTNLVNTTSLTLHEDHSFRYLYVVSSRNTATTQQGDVDVENLFIRKYVDPEPELGTWGSEETENGIVLPTVTTQDADGIAWDDGTYHATFHGTITDTGGENCYQRGFYWGPNPVADPPGGYLGGWTPEGSYGVGAFEYLKYELEWDTVYYRAVASNSEGDCWGEERSFDKPPSGNNPPTITSASIPDRDDTDNLYAMKKFYSFVAVVNDADGATDIDKVYLRGKNGAATLWEVRIDDLTGSGSWSIQSGATIIDVDEVNWQENGDSGTATFDIRLEWDHDNLAALDLEVYVEDSAEASAGWTVMQTNYWDAINRLVTISFAASDGRINVEGSVTFSGLVRYATTISGNTASSSYPPDAQFTAVRIHDTGHTVRGSDTSISNGAFSLNFNIPSATQNNIYHVYLDLVADYTDADAPDGDTDSVIGDRIKILTLDANNTEPAVDEYVLLYATAELEYDGHDLGAGDSLSLESLGFDWNATSSQWEKVVVSGIDESRTYDEFTSGNEATYGITAGNMNGQSVMVTWGDTNPPTITSASISNMDNSDNLYAMKQFYSFIAVVNDPDGAVDIEKVYIQGKNGVNILWEVRLDDLTGSGSVSIYSGSTIIDLDAESAATWEEDGDEGTATFNIWLEGDHPNLANLEIAVYVEDSGGESAGWTIKQTDYWDAINRLVTTGFVASDGRVNRGGSDTLSGSVRYATTNTGDSASSSYPPDGQFTAVRIHDSDHTIRGSDTTISNGEFSVSISIPDEVQSNPYHVYLDMIPGWSDGDAPDGDIASVIGDQVHATATSASDYRASLEENVNIDFTLKYAYDETLMVDGTGTIEGYSATHQGSGVWRIPQNRSSMQSVLYDEFTSSGNTYNITSVSADGQSVSVIWDRFIVTGLWASKVNPISGESVYLYATGELEYDGHSPDIDDSLNISGVEFDWDWSEERFYAEVNKSTPGSIKYDTLTSVEEYSYGITVGTMDGNTVTVAWGGFCVTFLGLFSENGTLEGAVDVTAHLPSGAEVFEVDGEVEKGFMEIPEMFTFSLAGGGNRYIYSFQANETLYLFGPDGTYSIYNFLIRDYTNQIGKSNAYLESLRIVNGTERMVERMIIWDTANTVPLTLVQSQMYALQIRFADNSTYRFGYFIPGTDPTPTLSLYNIPFSEQAHIPAEHIIVEALRPSDTHIQVNYKDELNDTEEFFVEVCLLNGTQVWNDIGAGDILQFNWYGADNETDYMVNVKITHGFYGELTYTCWLAGAQAEFDGPIDLSVFGDWPIESSFAVFIIFATACLFSRGSAVIGMGVTVIVTAVLAGIGWINIAYSVIAAAFALVVLWGLSGGAK